MIRVNPVVIVSTLDSASRFVFHGRREHVGASRAKQQAAKSQPKQFVIEVEDA